MTGKDQRLTAAHPETRTVTSGRIQVLDRRDEKRIDWDKDTEGESLSDSPAVRTARGVMEYDPSNIRSSTCF